MRRNGIQVQGNFFRRHIRVVEIHVGKAYGRNRSYVIQRELIYRGRLIGKVGLEKIMFLEGTAVFVACKVTFRGEYNFKFVAVFLF